MTVVASDRLDRLADQAKTWYSTLTDHVFRHTTIQIVLIGWALASDSARQRVMEFDPAWRLALALLPLAYSLMVIIIYRRVAGKSAYVMSELAELDKQAHRDLQTYAIPPDWWISMAAIHVLLSVLVVFLLLV